jgi:hypothetical protein
VATRTSQRASGRYAKILLGVVLALSTAAHVYGQPKTDVVTLANGDRITGEVVVLERGRLKFETDDAGTLYLEWDKLASVVATRLVEVEKSDGTRFLGTLGAAPARSIAVVGSVTTTIVPMSDVTLITAIGTSFWRKVDGSIDAGFSYTRSSGIAQLNANWTTIYRRPAFQAGVTASLTQTQTDDGSGSDDRGYIETSYLRYPWQRWFFAAASRFESNESVGIKLRSQVGGAVGPRLVNSNRAQLALGGGLVVNDERGVDVEPTQNIEGLLLFRMSYFTYDRPKTNLDVNVQYYPSLSNLGRQRLQLDAGVKRELLKDFFVGVSMYNTYDSRPPNPTADTNDVGVVMSLGWSY